MPRLTGAEEEVPIQDGDWGVAPPSPRSRPTRSTTRPARPPRRPASRRSPRRPLRPPSCVSEYQVPNAVGVPNRGENPAAAVPALGTTLHQGFDHPGHGGLPPGDRRPHRRDEGRVAAGVDEHLARPSRTRRRCRRGRRAAAPRGRRFPPTHPRPGADAGKPNAPSRRRRGPPRSGSGDRPWRAGPPRARRRR